MVSHQIIHILLSCFAVLCGHIIITCFLIAFIRPVTGIQPNFAFYQLIGMTKNGDIREEGAEVIWVSGGGSFGEWSAYLPSMDTLIICQGFIFWRPSCTYIPTVQRSLLNSARIIRTAT